MAHLTRADGVTFVVQAYRELFTIQRKSTAAQEIRTVSEQQGAFLSLSRKQRHQIEVAFSQDEGYLLAETVWQHFSRPSHLIFVEALPDREEVVLIVVRDSSIYLDRLISDEALRGELLPLMTGDVPYHIVTSGEVSLSASDDPLRFTFLPRLVAEFEQLDAPLIPKLPTLKMFKLAPLPIALRGQLLSMRFQWVASGVVMLLASAGIVWFFQSGAPKPSPLLTSAPVTQHAPDAFTRAMASPDPSRMLNEIAQLLSQLYFIPGWHAEQMALDQSQYVILLKPEGGELTTLAQWAQQRQYQFEVTAQGPKLIRRSAQKASRDTLPPRLPLETLAAKLFDEVDALLQEKAIEVGQVKSIGKMRKMDVILTVDNISPEILQLLGREFLGLPLSLSRASLSIQSGLVHGTLQLSLWGT